MDTINQNNAFKTLESALVPKTDLVDGRTELDRLNFLVEFGALINFYDRNNTIEGDWRPFLLKDPIFLLAEIAKTPFQKLHALYISTSLNLQEKLKKEEESKDSPTLINELYNQFIYVFQLLGQWSLHMLRYTGTYRLKEYMIRAIQETYSTLLWALIALNKELALTKYVPGIKLVDITIFPFTDLQTWKTNKDKQPFWKILGLKDPLAQNSILEIYDVLHQAGNKIFGFLDILVTNAKEEFENIKNSKSPFPDTVLLRTFTNLLKPYSNQLNGLAEKHLEFYYKDILKQETKGAIADRVYITATLNSTQKPFALAANTLFNAGTYPDNSPIVFQSIKNTSLNPGVLVDALTLAQRENTSGYTQLAYQKITAPGVLRKNEGGQPIKWSTFGDPISKTAKTTKNGCAFASPLFYLGESKGIRTLTLEFSFDGDIPDQFVADFSYALSTKDKWLEISKDTKRLESSTISGQILTLKIVLKPADPVIEAFTKNPDGYASPWPLFRILFSAAPSLETAPGITSLKISVDVLQLKAKVLYNDFGSVPAKKPFQPFGPSPKIGANFIVGSREVFSKPLRSLQLTLQWNGLPEMFSTYYEAYNDYLDPPKKENLIARIKKLRSPQTDTTDQVFNNTSFKVGFRLLQNGSWKTISISNNTNEAAPDTQKKTAQEKLAAYLDYQGLLQGEKKQVTPLFNQTLPSPSVFQLDQEQMYTPIAAPDLQKGELKFSEDSTFGFLEMELANPQYGFGSSLYAQVVSAVTLANAEAIAKSLGIFGSKPELINTPNLPYTPVASELLLQYQSEITYNFGDEEKGDYPLEVFYYAPFNNYKVYDTKNGLAKEGVVIGSPSKTTTSLPLYATTIFKGQLFLELEALSTPAPVNFYFQLARTTTTIKSPSHDVAFYYLSTTGWQPLTVLNDETNSFSCSGIVTFNIPDDITKVHPTLPGQSYWLSIGTKDKPANYPQTVFLGINGIALQRKLPQNIDDSIALHLAAKSLTKPQNAIPQIANIQQPFASFGGIPPENRQQNNLRISTRLGNKDRLLTAQDYFRTVLLSFPEVFYVKTNYDPTTRQTMVLAVKKIQKNTGADAFSPLIDTCLELEVQTYLQSRSMNNTTINVANFEQRYLRLVAQILIAENLEAAGVAKTINEGIAIFLAPWIESTQAQIAIDTGVSTSQLASFIKSFDAVLDIEAIAIELGTKDEKTGIISYATAVQELLPTSESILLVPAMDNSKIVYS